MSIQQVSTAEETLLLFLPLTEREPPDFDTFDCDQELTTPRFFVDEKTLIDPETDPAIAFEDDIPTVDEQALEDSVAYPLDSLLDATPPIPPPPSAVVARAAVASPPAPATDEVEPARFTPVDGPSDSEHRCRIMRMPTGLELPPEPELLDDPSLDELPRATAATIFARVAAVTTLVAIGASLTIALW